MAIIDIDITEPVNMVRVMVGDVGQDCEIMSDNMYSQILDKYNAYEEPLQLWYSAMYACDIIKNHYAPSGYYQREMAGMVSADYNLKDRYNNYVALSKWLKQNPPIDVDVSEASFYFGGTRVDTSCTLQIESNWLDNCVGCLGNRWYNGYILTES